MFTIPTATPPLYGLWRLYTRVGPIGLPVESELRRHYDERRVQREIHPEDLSEPGSFSKIIQKPRSQQDTRISTRYQDLI